VAVKGEVAPLPLSPDLPKPPRVFVLAEQPALDFRPWSQPPGRAPRRQPGSAPGKRNAGKWPVRQQPAHFLQIGRAADAAETRAEKSRPRPAAPPT